jgi:hypothetical protein
VPHRFYPYTYPLWFSFSIPHLSIPIYQEDVAISTPFF